MMKVRKDLSGKPLDANKLILIEIRLNQYQLKWVRTDMERPSSCVG